jgi:hypothetical protein
MKRFGLPAFFLLVTCAAYEAHNVGTAITWNRDISRIFYQRCASCHHEGGSAFSMMKYSEVRPRAIAIKESVLSRRMPPWGAVKGFGDFRNDEGLTQEELSLITAWIDSDTPQGSNPNALPIEPKFDKKDTPLTKPKNGIDISGDVTVSRAITLDGVLPENIPTGTSIKVVAKMPNGSIEPLVWFYEYTNKYQHPFLYRHPLNLPSGTVIRGVPPNATIVLMPAE